MQNCCSGSIPPFGEGKLVVVCTTPFTGAEAKVNFVVVGIPKSSALVQFVAGNHLISGRYCSASISTNEEKNFAIRKKENDDSRYDITWTIKTSHPPPLLKTPSTVSSPPVSAAPSAPSPEKVVERGLPSNSLLGIDSSRLSRDGEPVLDAALALSGSSSWQVQVNVVNDSQYGWNLDEQGLESGDWKREPQIELKPFSRSTWYCLPSFAGAMGYAKYHCNNAPNIIFFTKWTAKVLSAPQVDAVVHGPEPRLLNSELKVSHTSDCIIVDVSIFEVGSLNQSRLRGAVQPPQKKLEKPMSSPSNRASPSPSSSVSLKVFRLPIEVLVNREERGLQVPWLVESICDWLVSEHCKTSGLFAQGGRYHEIKELKALIESGQARKTSEETGYAPWRRFAPASTISILKLFLRELPVPLIPVSQMPQFISLESPDSASSYADSKVPNLSSTASTSASSSSNATNLATARAIHKLLKELPPVNRATLVLFTQALRELWRAQGSVHTLDAISIVFAPLIAPDKPDGSLKSALPAMSAFSTLIEHIHMLPNESPSLDRQQEGIQ